ncbi:MAG: hypothetical protein KAX69_04860 [Chitinophagales bacterium]|nr:hypothetical protein [Chitinophagales bacterium]
MNSFFLLNTQEQVSVIAQFAGYVIFYKKSKDAATAEIQLSLLSKLIENGLKLSTENFLFIDTSSPHARISSLKKSLEIKKCFFFGVLEKEIGINIDIPLYQLVEVGETEFLKADAPEMLEKEKLLKNQLWKQLQISFKLI